MPGLVLKAEVVWLSVGGCELLRHPVMTIRHGIDIFRAKRR